MRIGLLVFSLVLAVGCNQAKESTPDAREIVDKAIAVSGGELYRNSKVTFKFRDHIYSSDLGRGRKTLRRLTLKGDSTIEDIRTNNGLVRLLNGKEFVLPDSLAGSIANSVNSVHYFAYLPYGLNDPAVNKRFLDTVVIKGRNYNKIEITFKEEGGGEDFEDVYVYWFDKETNKPDYLAYSFHIDGGGLRFREAFNERYVNGLRFVDYRNYKPPTKEVQVARLDSLFLKGELEVLSVIALDSIQVTRGSYN